MLLVCASGIFFVRGNIARGRRFVRAYIFLNALEMGCSVEEANAVAAFAFTKYADAFEDHRSTLWAKQYSRVLHGGKQLPVIAEARVKGFEG